MAGEWDIRFCFPLPISCLPGPRSVSYTHLDVYKRQILKVPVHSDKFGRIATQNAKNVILQKIREEERKVLFDQYHGNEKEVVTGIVQRVVGHNVSVNLGKADAILAENEQVKGCLLYTSTITIPLQSFIRTVVFLPVTSASARMQLQCLTCFPDILSRRTGIV